MKKFIFLISLSVASFGFAQDIHFSQSSEVPLLINPGATGAFNGWERVIVNHRNQWLGANTQFMTTSLAVDLNILKNANKQLADNPKEPFALLFVDLDGFKQINDSLGHKVGDKVLKEIALRISNVCNQQLYKCRWGGDEFLILATYQNQTELIEFANKVLQSISAEHETYKYQKWVSATIGMAMYPEHGSDFNTLIRSADTAMYHAKDAGKNRFQFFQQEMNIKAQGRLELENKLRRAVKEKQFKLVYQPQFDFQTGRLISCEALLRWVPSESNRAVLPDIFIPIMERSDLILLIGEWVLKHACMQAREWKKAGINIRIDINVSGKQLERIDFFNQLEAYRDEYGLSASDLGIELTEHTLIQSPDWLIEALNTQKEQGMNIALDDFGTGYSSLSYLKNFPITHLKIDRSFIHLAPEHDLDAALVQSMVNIGHQLNLTIVAEGVETPSQSQFCQAQNIDVVQGYLYAKPMPAEQIPAYITQAIQLR